MALFGRDKSRWGYDPMKGLGQSATPGPSEYSAPPRASQSARPAPSGGPTPPMQSPHGGTPPVQEPQTPHNPYADPPPASVSPATTIVRFAGKALIYVGVLLIVIAIIGFLFVIAKLATGDSSASFPYLTAAVQRLIGGVFALILGAGVFKSSDRVQELLDQIPPAPQDPHAQS